LAKNPEELDDINLSVVYYGRPME